MAAGGSIVLIAFAGSAAHLGPSCRPAPSPGSGMKGEERFAELGETLRRPKARVCQSSSRCRRSRQGRDRRLPDRRRETPIERTRFHPGWCLLVFGKLSASSRGPQPKSGSRHGLPLPCACREKKRQKSRRSLSFSASTIACTALGHLGNGLPSLGIQNAMSPKGR